MPQDSSDKVVCETPTPGKQPTRIDRWKYDAVRRAILKVTPRRGGWDTVQRTGRQSEISVARKAACGIGLRFLVHDDSQAGLGSTGRYLSRRWRPPTATLEEIGCRPCRCNLRCTLHHNILKTCPCGAGIEQKNVDQGSQKEEGGQLATRRRKKTQQVFPNG